mmetsp:Transcript_8598/g.27403  ORF Transcript_8598/g.27403 Transcript_8598/m.27403 type:complete len:213 (-) Transcript_8598:892-1530(-)
MSVDETIEFAAMEAASAFTSSVRPAFTFSRTDATSTFTVVAFLCLDDDFFLEIFSIPEASWAKHDRNSEQDNEAGAQKYSRNSANCVRAAASDSLSALVRSDAVLKNGGILATKASASSTASTTRSHWLDKDDTVVARSRTSSSSSRRSTRRATLVTRDSWRGNASTAGSFVLTSHESIDTSLWLLRRSSSVRSSEMLKPSARPRRALPAFM